MLWWGLWTAVAALGGVAALAAINGARFRRRVAREVRAMWAASTSPAPLDRRRFATLPAPVQRYAAAALGNRDRPVRSVRLRHGGTFRAKLDGPWLPIHGEQYFAADAPAFIWWGRVRVGPGVWVDARDRSIEAAGNMLVSLESTFALADVTGPEIDQGALCRLLAEMVWFPTALFDERYVSWSAIDDRSARATLRLQGREVSGTFELGGDDLPASFSAQRYRDLGNGRSALTPFTGEYGDYRLVGGLRVPHRATASWQVPEPAPYVRFVVEELQFDEETPFQTL